MNPNTCNSLIIILIAFAFRNIIAKGIGKKTTNTRLWNTEKKLYIQFTRIRSDDVLVIDFGVTSDWLSLVLNLTSNESDPTKDSKSSSVSSSTSKVVQNLKSDFVKVGLNEIILVYSNNSNQLIVKDKHGRNIQKIPLLKKPPACTHVKVRGLNASINKKPFSDEYISHEVNGPNVDIPIEFDNNFAFIQIVNEEWFEGAIYSDGVLKTFSPSNISQLQNLCQRRNEGIRYNHSVQVSLPREEKWNLTKNHFVTTVIQFHCLIGCPFKVYTRILNQTSTESTRKQSPHSETEDIEENAVSEIISLLPIIIPSLLCVVLLIYNVRINLNLKKLNDLLKNKNTRDTACEHTSNSERLHQTETTFPPQESDYEQYYRNQPYTVPFNRY